MPSPESGHRPFLEESPTNHPAGESARALGTVGVLALFAAVATYQIQPPKAPASPPGLEEFSVDRALRSLKEVARRPHPMGSAEHARVRQYLVEQLTALGCEVDVQMATGVHDNPSAAGEVQNVLCRVRATIWGDAGSA